MPPRVDIEGCQRERQFGGRSEPRQVPLGLDAEILEEMVHLLGEPAHEGERAAVRRGLARSPCGVRPFLTCPCPLAAFGLGASLSSAMVFSFVIKESQARSCTWDEACLPVHSGRPIASEHGAARGGVLAPDDRVPNFGRCRGSDEHGDQDRTRCAPHCGTPASTRGWDAVSRREGWFTGPLFSGGNMPQAPRAPRGRNPSGTPACSTVAAGATSSSVG